jgi:hypothetical protein
MYSGMQDCISSLTVGTLISKSADVICYDGYDLSHNSVSEGVLSSTRARVTAFCDNVCL